jgi:hypothetical protein
VKHTVIILLLVACFNRQSHSQNALPDLVERFFKVSPFEGEFSSFFKELSTDTSFAQKTLQKRTADKPFYFSGAYREFSPFRFKPNKVIVTLGDLVINYGKEGDTAFHRDTVLLYSISGLTQSGEKGKETVEKELKWFHRRFGLSFAENRHESSGAEGNYVFEKYSYAVFPKQTPSVLAVWNPIAETDQYAFTVSLLIKVRQNTGFLPD